MTHAEIWETLESTAPVSQESRRRVEPDSIADVWFVLKGKQRLRTLRIEISDLNGLGNLPNGKGIHTEIFQTGTGMYLDISLQSNRFSDVFDVLVLDLINAAVTAPSQDAVTSAVANRILHWQEFLRQSLDGLTSEAQRGLFGELKVLEWLAQSTNLEMAVAHWAGPKGYSQDFHVGATSIEVKTSASKNPQSLRISSERQLDTSNLDFLALWHWSVDERLDHGQTLASLIDDIRRNLKASSAQQSFEDSLLRVGYLDIHASRYKIGYGIRSLQVYEVSDEFPRIVEADCSDGLGDVSYSIQLGALTRFLIEIEALQERINLAKD